VTKRSDSHAFCGHPRMKDPTGASLQLTLTTKVSDKDGFGSFVGGELVVDR